MKNINWDATKEEYKLIGAIVRRALALFPDRLRADTLNMDILACHANGCPLDLQTFLNGDDMNFAHDIGGITKHINRHTGQLEDCFVPRYAQ